MSDPQPDNPYKEPENSTVDDWHGQKVDRQIEEAEADSDDEGKGKGTRGRGTSAG